MNKTRTKTRALIPSQFTDKAWLIGNAIGSVSCIVYLLITKPF
jgi:hypothetical protein